MNRLRSMLASVFPGLEQALNLTTLAALRLVSRFTTPAQIRTAGEQTVQAELVELGVRRPTAASLARTALSAAVGQSIRLPGEELTASLIVRQAAKLAELHGELYELDKAIAAQFRRHQKAAIIESLPGFGPVVGAEFLVATGGELAWFPSSGHLAALAGLVPVARDSGRVSGNLHRPKRYNRRLHRAFYIAALSSLKGSEISRGFYERKRTERLTHVQALLALARRLVDVLWALLRDNRTFTVDPPRARRSAAA